MNVSLDGGEICLYFLVNGLAICLIGRQAFTYVWFLR
jgi:hypothetical protein